MIRALYIAPESGNRYRVRGRVVRITYVRLPSTVALVFPSPVEALAYAREHGRLESDSWGARHARSLWGAQHAE